MGEPVLLQLTQLPEGAAALSAAVRPLSGVDALVLVQAVEVAESLVAVAARVRSLPRVNALVGLQAVEAPEAAAAHVAAVDLVRAVSGGLHGAVKGDARLGHPRPQRRALHLGQSQ